MLSPLKKVEIHPLPSKGNILSIVKLSKLAIKINKMLSKTIGIKNKLERTIEENPNLLATIIARINKSIIIGTEVLGKKIIFNPSEKLLSKILIVKIK